MNSTNQNLLLVMVDEMQAAALGCAGHPVAQTPNIDALAAAGTRFSTCWTPSPICVPARASFATGRFVHEIRNWDSASGYEGAPAGWAHVLRDAGYATASIGKLHHRGAEHDDGFTEQILPMFTPAGIGWVQGLQRDPLPDYAEAGELAADTGVGHTSYTRYDDRIADAAVAWLDARATIPGPWAAFVSFVAPHYPLSAPEEFSALYPLSEVPPVNITFKAAAQTDAHPTVAAMRRFWNYDSFFDPALRVQARRAYFALCSWVDALVGRVLDALDATGQRDRTTIIFTSDHGEFLGNRGLWCKSFMYRDAVEVPMIVAGPGVGVGAVCATPVNLVDVAATAAGVAGVDPRFPGQDLAKAAANPTRDRVSFSEYHDGGSPTGLFAVQNGPWKLIEYVGAPAQLFNLDDDPDELVDLASEPRCRRELAQAQAVLRDICDPVEVNRQAFADQSARIQSLGGPAALADAFRFNHTPAPEADE